MEIAIQPSAEGKNRIGRGKKEANIGKVLLTPDGRGPSRRNEIRPNAQNGRRTASTQSQCPLFWRSQSAWVVPATARRVARRRGGTPPCSKYADQPPTVSSARR